MAAMKKTLNINLAGQLFRIDEDAFEILTRYLNHVSNRFRTEQGGDETMADIESRIAEIFGGGKEPPTLVSREMVNDMINIMGAPEDYYDEASGTGSTVNVSYTRKNMYDPNSLSARVGKGFSEFFRMFGKFMTAVWRVMSVIIGSAFTVFGFSLIFLFVLMFFFNNAPFMKNIIEPEISDIHMLLSIVLNSNTVWLIIILAAVVILFPLTGIAYLGIKMIFNIREKSKVFSMIMLITWIAAVCALGVILSLQLVVYANTQRLQDRINLDNPPEKRFIAPGKKISSIRYDEHTTLDDITFYRDKTTEKLFVSVDLDINSSDTTTGWINIQRRACSNGDVEAWTNAQNIEYTWKLSGDTLYLDEFFSLPEGKNWNGSMVDIDIALPQGAEIEFISGIDHARMAFGRRGPHINHYRVSDWYAEPVEE